MIKLTRLNGKQFWLNADLIETVEETPDVVVTLTNSHKYVVTETGAEIVNKVISYRRNLQLAATKEEACR